MKKKLYYKLSDNGDLGGVIMELGACMEWIDSGMEDLKEEDQEDYVWTLEPVFMTEDEFNNLEENDNY